MRWLLHGNLTPAVADALRRHKHSVTTLAEIGAAETGPEELLKLAQTRQLDIVTNDEHFARLPYEMEKPFKRVIVFLQLDGQDVEQDDAIDRLFARFKRLSPGRLYTVTGSRAKVRQLPNRST